MGLDIDLQSTVAHEYISHNYVGFAKELGVYYPIWRGDMYGIKRAQDLIPFLEFAIKLLDDEDVVREASKKLKDKEHDSVEEFKQSIISLHRHCWKYPSARVHFSR